MTKRLRREEPGHYRTLSGSIHVRWIKERRKPGYWSVTREPLGLDVMPVGNFTTLAEARAKIEEVPRLALLTSNDQVHRGV